jgi:hypothetical protein
LHYNTNTTQKTIHIQRNGTVNKQNKAAQATTTTTKQYNCSNWAKAPSMETLIS